MSAADPVILFAHDQQWRTRFSVEARRLRETFGDDVRTLHHIGSTSVPGLLAKPIVDVQLALPSFNDLARTIAALESLDYAYFPDDLSGHRFFRRPVERPRRVHLHVCVDGSVWQREHLLFRDYLRSEGNAARRYESEKVRLAQQFTNERAAYQEGKTPTIEALLAEAKRWAEKTGWQIPPSDA